MRVVLPLGLCVSVWLCAMTGCTPSFNWREVVLPQANVVALFPCRPDVGERPASAEGPAMGLAHCEAGGQSFSLSWADLAEVSLVDRALQDMPRSLAAKLGATVAAPSTASVPGMTPHASAGQFVLRGGQGVATLMVFVHGLRVYQAIVRGAHEDVAATQTYLGALRVAPR